MGFSTESLHSKVNQLHISLYIRCQPCTHEMAIDPFLTFAKNLRGSLSFLSRKSILISVCVCFREGREGWLREASDFEESKRQTDCRSFQFLVR